MAKKILLAGPGTGKTRKIKDDFLSSVKDFKKVLILSFTNATVNDLRGKFSKAGIEIDEKNCMTLHSYALRLNHKRELHVLNNQEEKIIENYANSLKVDFAWFCELLSCITYDQMVLNLVKFKEINPTYFRDSIGEIELLIIDEFQDFNDFEQSLVHLISQYAQDTLILGDDDQAIYGFKDAKPDGIIALHKDISFEKIPHENICYRCPDSVIEKCGNLIAFNTNRVPKIWNKRGKVGTIDFQQMLTISETVKWVAEEIEIIKGIKPDATFLVLAPVKFAIEGLDKQLSSKNIEHEDYFKESLDPNLVKMVWRLRLVYGDNKLLNFLLIIKANKLEPYPASKFKKILKNHVNTSFTFTSIYPDAKDFLDKETVEYLENPPLIDELLKNETWSQLAGFFNEAEGDTVHQKLERILKYLDPPMLVDKKKVNIMSIHKSKGLEAEYVFILGVVDGIMPREAVGLEGIEHDRRVFFVGMSRAEVALHLVATVRWNVKDVHRLSASKFTPHGRYHRNGRTSPFISELKL